MKPPQVVPSEFKLQPTVVKKDEQAYRNFVHEVLNLDLVFSREQPKKSITPSSRKRPPL
jgi:hypothetical protein